MATVSRPYFPSSAVFPSSSFCARKMTQGTNYPVPALAFDSAATETAYWSIDVETYGAAATTFDVKIRYYADTATTGDAKFDVAFACMTPNSDNADIETKAFATLTTGTKTHPGTTGQRPIELSITGVANDSCAAGDFAMLRVRRLGADAADTMAGDAMVVEVVVSYSDT